MAEGVARIVEESYRLLPIIPPPMSSRFARSTGRRRTRSNPCTESRPLAKSRVRSPRPARVLADRKSRSARLPRAAPRPRPRAWGQDARCRCDPHFKATTNSRWGIDIHLACIAHCIYGILNWEWGILSPLLYILSGRRLRPIPHRWSTAASARAIGPRTCCVAEPPDSPPVGPPPGGQPGRAGRRRCTTYRIASIAGRRPRPRRKHSPAVRSRTIIRGRVS